MSKLTAPITSRAVFFRTFSTFLASGLTLRSALPKAGEHFSPLDVGGVLSSIDQGKSLADSLASTELFSDLEIIIISSEKLRVTKSILFCNGFSVENRPPV